MSNQAVRDRTPHVTPETVALERMLLIRAVEERLLALFSAGKLFGTTHTCIGQETTAVGVVGALDLTRDIVFSTHRCHGHYLMYSNNPEALIAEIMGRQSGTCGGRGGSQHLYERNFFSNGVQGGILPVATGVALAEQFRGSDAVTVAFLGDGTLGEGAVYEALNMAALWRAPVVFVLEHNRYAQSTPTERTTAGEVTARATAFGIPSDRRPADDPVALQAHMREVVARVRAGAGPFFQVLDTYRLAAHSKGDDDRDPQEIAEYRRRDPLLRLRTELGEAVAAPLAEGAERRIDAAVAAAEAIPYAGVDPDADAEAFAARSSGSAPAAAAFAGAADEPTTLVVQHLNAALHTMMAENDEVILLGEDLHDPYGGAFKVSRGLSTRFPQRVLSTPISEAGFIGIGTGLGLRGYRPVVEIMFGDFLALGADQVLNHLAKFRWMYNDRVETPVVIRTPVGGRRGYGPTHSQSIEKMFLGVPGLVVVAISLYHHPGTLLRRAVLEDPRPVLFLEQKLLYAKRLVREAPPGMVLDLHDSERHALYPTVVWRPADVPAEVTVVTYGAMTDIVEEAIAIGFDEDEVIAEYVVPSQLAPLHLAPIVDSVRRTGRLLVVEEGTAPWGFGAELVARVVESMQERGPRCGRVAAHHLPIPNARPAEDLVLPDAARVVAAMRALRR
ncbi:thiamine pyrophosphate-dependent enzyme [Candidatus Binatia bacterium]|nr:thiamine pyrophosphate-dependent enzyme [Candidatus Binatia bacterium]